MGVGYGARAAVAALWLCAAGAAQAATVTVTDTGAPGPDTPINLSVAGFDTALGTLTSVAWTLAVDQFAGTATYTNPTGATLTANNGTDRPYYYFFLGTTSGLALAPVATVFSSVYNNSFQSLLNADGTFFAPTLAPGQSASVTFPGYTWRFAGSTSDPVGLGAGPLGSWLNGAIDLTVLATAAFEATIGAAAFSATSGAAATLSVIYTYTPASGSGGGPVDPAPVPLPAGLPLMLAGIGALAVVRRRLG
jgi:hypothetical protein